MIVQPCSGSLSSRKTDPVIEGLLEDIQRIWLTKVRADAGHARLWNNEDAVAASLYYHLRKDIIDERKQLRIWLTPSIPLSSKKKIQPDLVKSRLPENYVNEREEYERVVYEGMIIAIELKSRFITRWSVIRDDFERLLELRKEYPGIGVMFGFLNNTVSGKRFEYVKQLSEEFSITTLYGNEKRDVWKVIGQENVEIEQEKQWLKCSYCQTVFHYKDREDHPGVNCPMCGSIPERTATKDDSKRARIAECLRDEEGDNITDETFKFLGIDPDELGK